MTNNQSILVQFLNTSVVIMLNKNASVQGKLAGFDDNGVVLHAAQAKPAGTRYFPWEAIEEIQLSEQVVPLRNVA